MEVNTGYQPMLPPVSQIGIVVKDVEKTAEYYASKLGIGPFTFQDITLPQATLRDNPATIKIRIALAQMGPIQIELIQPMEGDEFYAEFLYSMGEGVHHLGSYVDDINTLDSLLAELGDRGIIPICRYTGSKFAFAHLDTQATGGVILELVHINTQQKVGQS